MAGVDRSAMRRDYARAVCRSVARETADPFRVVRWLRQAEDRDVARVVDRWDDEGSEAALAGNPRRAHYLDRLVADLLGGRRRG